jgi:hypothetical protein
MSRLMVIFDQCFKTFLAIIYVSGVVFATLYFLPKLRTDPKAMVFVLSKPLQLSVM